MQIKRLEATSRSPIFSLLSECLSGLPSLRAFGGQALLHARFERLVDNNNKVNRGFRFSRFPVGQFGLPLQFSFAGQHCARWLAFWLDMTCIVFLAFVTFGAVALRSRLDAGIVGNAISWTLALTGSIQWLVRQVCVDIHLFDILCTHVTCLQTTEVENQMVSVERILDYARLPVEDVDLVTPASARIRTTVNPIRDSAGDSTAETTHQPVAKGTVVFNNVWMKYR